MSEIRKKYDEGFKKNAIKLSYASPKSVREIADDLGINDGMLYRWRRRYTADGNKTVFAGQDEELKKLRPENGKRLGYLSPLQWLREWDADNLISAA